jgi:hypothetical protein
MMQIARKCRVHSEDASESGSVTAAAVDGAAGALERRERRVRTGRRVAAGAVALAALALPFSTPLAIAFVLGAAVETSLCALARSRRRGLIARLALESEAYVIPAVREYGAHLVGPLQRERLGRWLVEVLDDAGHPDSLYLADRVAEHAGQIQAVAAELMAPGARVHPVSAATCRRLLTVATESPLYNPHLPAVDLRSTLFRIHAGISAPS